MKISTAIIVNTHAVAFVLVIASGSSFAQGKTAPAIVEVDQVTAARLAPAHWVPGSVVSRNDAKVASAGAGRLQYVAEVGARVSVGERLAQIDDRMLRLHDEEILADVRRAQAQRALAETQLQRLEKLAATNAIAQTQIDEARATLETNAQTLAHARAQLREIEYEIDQASVKSPFAGVVTERFAQRGEYLQVGAAIVHLVDTDQIEVRVEAPLALADKIHSGMEVKVKAGGKESSGRIRALVPVGDERARQFELRVGVSPALVLVGSAVEVSLPENSGEETLVVSRDAIVLRADRAYVVRVSAQNVAEQVPVSTGNASGDKIEVHGALAVGDRLVVRGAERLTPGQAVTVSNAG
jgi:RND family efflux transporter MFP subunit